MSERKSLSGGDWAAIGTFLVGTLVAVLMAYGLLTGVGGATGTAALGAAIAAAFGAWPALVGGAGVALLGARAFLTGDRARLLASALGVAGVALGLTVIAGSFSATGGGAFGAATGGRVAEIAHAAVGALLGAIVAFGAAYLAWMREDPAAAARLAPARRLTPAPPKGDDGVSAAESAMLFPEERAEGARAAPAPKQVVQPLYPEDVRLRGEIPAGTQPLATPGAAADERVAPARARTAGAAAGALPAAAEPAVYRWTAPRAQPAPDPTRIAAEEIEALADAAPPIPAPAAAAEAGTDWAADSAEASAAHAPSAAIEAPAAEDALAALDEVTDETDEADARPMPPRPTWETTGLSEEDEPVDAYGTPLSLVAKARRDAGGDADLARIPRELDAPADGDASARDEAALEALEAEIAAPASPAFAAEALEVEPPATGTLGLEAAQPEPDRAPEHAPDGEPLVAERVVLEVVRSNALAPHGAQALDADALDADAAARATTEQATDAAGSEPAGGLALERASESPDALLEELRASNAALRAESGDQAAYDALEQEALALDAESDVLAELDDVLASEAEAAAVADVERELESERESDRQDARARTAAAQAEGADGELHAAPEARVEAPEPLAEDPAAESAVAALEGVLAQEPEPAPEPVIAVVPAPRGKPASSRAAASLFDAVEGEEPEVVLAPQAAVPASRAEKSVARGLDPEKKLLAEVGCMFVDRGRVAVSMLQRQYGMDFEAACRVLDDLQEMGLIGPYLGGKSRDILLTKDQWMEKVGAG